MRFRVTVGVLAGLLLAAGCSSGGTIQSDAGNSATGGSGTGGSATGGSGTGGLGNIGALGGSKSSPLAGHYYWGTADGKNFLGVYFADGSRAYTGLPHQGLPSCTDGDTGSGTPQGIDAQGCTTYSYDASSGAVAVGSMQGTYSSSAFTLDGLHLAQLMVPSAGSTLSVSLISVYASGAGSDFSGGFSTLTLGPDGQFATASGASVGTLDGDVAALPADQHGTYRIAAGGKLELDFAAGTNVVRTIGIDQEDTRQPALRGAMLDSTYFENQATMNN
ncbi:hypothetical protein [Catenulispora pinisilvae]|uniref:hypothetical protein n=1 Tax=Catenulispora pinisilvae TaxID=2705253 RepID=UPI00189245F2|nr:hypothetical protein [Catenulispora pinisilvae]